MIAATNKDLDKAVERGEFRKDLYFRLKVMHLKLPSLRERKEDIELFAAAFLEDYSKNLKKQVKGFSEPAMEWLNNYHWPGNIRELRNIVERAVIVADGAMINTKHLSLDSGADVPPDSLIPPVIPEEGVDFKEIVDRISTELITRALGQTGGNRSQAARLLSMPRQVLLYQMKKLGLD